MSEVVTLYVGRISRSVTPEKLEDMFAECGKVARCALIREYAFVDFEDKDEAQSAVDKYNGYELDGKPLIVEIARQNKRDIESRGSGCYACGGRGHFARECPTRVGPPSRGSYSSGGGGSSRYGRSDRYAPSSRDRSRSRSRDRRPRRYDDRSRSRDRRPRRRSRSTEAR
ncbi:hypothetical protein H4R34_002758 [Dimargaris verticillata]|uniref:Uncharacterized protein n=1 Tax=Dimargaris verticillata TaxID=2761393 RepID=A0A9W8ED98_9FUNG|nr:hypothetical protein H4R34_002758 [Dimargaris verticillata]